MLRKCVLVKVDPFSKAIIIPDAPSAKGRKCVSPAKCPRFSTMCTGFHDQTRLQLPVAPWMSWYRRVRRNKRRRCAKIASSPAQGAVPWRIGKDGVAKNLEMKHLFLVQKDWTKLSLKSKKILKTTASETVVVFKRCDLVVPPPGISWHDKPPQRAKTTKHFWFGYRGRRWNCPHRWFPQFFLWKVAALSKQKKNTARGNWYILAT